MASVELERNVRERVCVVWMNRPDRRNALSAGLVEELRQALRELSADPDVGAVVLAGRGEVFCAGGDLKEGLADGDGFLGAHEGRGAYAGLLEDLMNSRLPVIAAVQGSAMGGGLGLAAATDMVVAGEGARLGTPELKLGLFPWIISAVLQRQVPRKRLAELIFTGSSWSAAEAFQAGLVTQVVADDNVITASLDLAARVAAFSPAIVGLGKRALHHIEPLSIEAGLRHMHSQLSLNLLTDDAAEGIAAFLQRRPPSWKGR